MLIPDLSPVFLSVKLALLTTLILLVTGLPLAYWLARSAGVFALLVEVIVTMPLVLPPTVLGFYLLVAFNPGHNPAHWLLQHTGLQLTFSFEGLLAGSVLYSLPFMITPLKAALQNLPPSLSLASLSLGKSLTRTFVSVLLPAMRPAVVSAVVISFAHTLGEFGVVLMIGGNIPGKTRLASMAIYDSVENLDYAAAGFYSLVLFGLAFLLITFVFIYNRKPVSTPLW